MVGRWIYTVDIHLKITMPQNKQHRYDPETLQLAVRVPRTLHQQFYAECKSRGTTGSKMLRNLMTHFVRMAAEEAKNNAGAKHG